MDKRFKPHVREKGPLGMKNTFLGNTKKKKSSALVTKHARW
jgi:hypothetical protein